jgi:hypothetical protein
MILKIIIKNKKLLPNSLIQIQYQNLEKTNPFLAQTEWQKLAKEEK